MDFVVRCNSLKCRVQLTEQAIVTTCSHIFCITCSENLGLAATAGPSRHCPACRALLPNPDDVVATSLNPTEDYKTSVLSGLSPAIIMECASRGLTFWSYQSTQEVLISRGVYQEYLAKTLNDKYATLNVQMDKLVNDANAEIDGLNQRFSRIARIPADQVATNNTAELQIDQEKLKQDNQTLLNALREKNRKFAQTNELYERLKRKEMAAVTQHAVFNSVDDALQAAAAAEPPSFYNSQRVDHTPLHNSFDHQKPPFPHSKQARPYHQRSGDLQKQDFLGSNHSPNLIGETPISGHRTRLGRMGLHVSPGQRNSHLHRASNLHPGHNHMPQNRQPLGPISGNVPVIRSENQHSGYGLSAGMRTGSLHGGLPGAGNSGSRGGPWIG